jgi:hypothetical protein
MRFCELLVNYNVRTPGGGLAGLNELDVVGLHFASSTAYLREVTTHIGGLLYGGGNRQTVQRVKTKHEKQLEYAKSYLNRFRHHVFMFWSPYVPKGYRTEHLEKIEGLEMVVNREYKRCVDELIEKAREERQDTGNPAFRLLQILGTLRD